MEELNNVQLFSDCTTMKVADALRQVMNVVKASVIAERWGKNRSLLYYAIDGKTGLGSPYALSGEDLSKVQTVINDLGYALMAVRFREGSQSEQVSSFCYGDTWVDKFKNFGKTFKLVFFVQECLGKNKRWQENRLSCKANKMYNRMDAKDIDAINALIRRVAEWMSNLEIVA